MARILIVDDSAFIRKMLTEILRRNNHEIVGEASNGLEGVEMFKQLHPDLVMLDITMPVMDGLDALKKIKFMYPDAKCLMCSAMGQQGIVIEAIKSGAIDFIVKPFNAVRVLEAVNKTLE